MRSALPKKIERLLMFLALAAPLAACGGGSNPGTTDGGADRIDARFMLEVGPDRPDAADSGGDRTETSDVLRDASTDGDARDGMISPDGGDGPHAPDAGDAPAPDVQPDLAPEVAADVAPDVAPDLAPDSAPDLAPDLASDDTAVDMADASNDLGDSCGAGCPSTIEPQALRYWLAADVGVSCDGNGRVTGWTNRGTLGGQLAPVSGKAGPLCSAPTSLGGRNVISFDDAGTDDTSGVLEIDLAPLVATNYTVIVVERRRSGAEGYFLGTAINNLALTTDCAIQANAAYQFGYSPPYLLAGPYVTNTAGDDCLTPQMQPAPFSATALLPSLDVDLFDAAVGHASFSNGVALSSDQNLDPIAPLLQGYLGRSFQALDSGTRHSRFKGDIAEVLIYATALTSDEQTAISAYLKARWGITP